MGRINLLSFEIANLIAAGEVVERPSSVLKELIENSIDAGATEIIAEIKRGGVALIRVTDNGHGIEKDDLPVALQRHATSKINSRDDLYKIMTLGFRGEALAAISSVSQVTIITKTKSADIGHMLTAEGGKVVDISEVGASDGTTVVVENLFYNVPARRKFLKKDSTEALNVSALVEKVALSRPDISIQLLIDGEERFKTSGDGELLNAIRAIFGRDFASKMIKVDSEASGIRVYGYVGRSDNVRKNRNLENVFINGRYVKSLTAQAAIERAFTSYIAPECFPCCALFLEMNPGIVDVNVHPAKLEVKFSDERCVFEAVYYSVKCALESEEYRPEMSLGKQKSDYNPAAAFVPIGESTKGEQLRISTPAERTFTSQTQSVRSPAERTSSPTLEGGARINNDNKSQTGAPSGTYGGINIDRPIRVASTSPRVTSDDLRIASSLTPAESLEVLKSFGKTEPLQDAKTEAESSTDKAHIDYKLVGEAFDTYVIVEYEGDLLIIDKHAAHERVIFEELLQSRKRDGRVGSQALLLPVCVILADDELACLMEYKDEFNSVGFEYNLNEKSCDITSIPDSISIKDAEGLFVEMIGEIIQGKGNPTVTEKIRRERALYQVACKAAIKGGRVYDKAIINWLVEKLLSLPDITVCPHGRPVAYRLKKNELDRQFDRIK